MAKVKIRHAGFVYQKQVETLDVNGKKTQTWHPVMAYRGDDVDIQNTQDLERGKREEAFWTNDFYPQGHEFEGAPKGMNMGKVFSEEQVPENDNTPDVEDATDVELAEWVGKHSISDVVALAGTNPEHAAKLLEAEETATGNDPRKGLVEALDKVIG